MPLTRHTENFFQTGPRTRGRESICQSNTASWVTYTIEAKSHNQAKRL